MPFSGDRPDPAIKCGSPELLADSLMFKPVEKPPYFALKKKRKKVFNVNRIKQQKGSKSLGLWTRKCLWSCLSLTS